MTTNDGAEVTALWPDERIVSKAAATGNPYMAAAMRSIALEMKYDYEQERRQLYAQISQVNGYYLRFYCLMHAAAIAAVDRGKRIYKLEAEIADARHLLMRAEKELFEQQFDSEIEYTDDVHQLYKDIGEFLRPGTKGEQV